MIKIAKVQFLSCKTNLLLISKVFEKSVKVSQFPRFDEHIQTTPRSDEHLQTTPQSDEHLQTTPLNIISTRLCFAESYADFLFSKYPDLASKCPT